MIEVWPAANSLAARPSITRHAPAKKRNRSAQTAISSIAAPTGLPALALSRRPSSSAFDLRASATLSRSSERSCGVVFFQVSNAVAAALTARSTSSAELAGTFAMGLSLAGLMTSAVRPSAASTNEPPMSC